MNMLFIGGVYFLSGTAILVYTRAMQCCVEANVYVNTAALCALLRLVSTSGNSLDHDNYYNKQSKSDFVTIITLVVAGKNINQC